MKRDYRDEFRRWKEAELIDADLKAELKVMEGDEALMEDAFYKDLAFGTGGLRGVIGAGTNRMNVHTVIKASKGIADYLNDEFGDEKKSIAISFDSRIKSELFAKTAAKVFAGCGIDVTIYKELMPTPCLSFAVRKLGCKVGVMITASHNPAKYNGYKVYGSDGCQITTEAAEKIQGYIDKADALDTGAIGENDEKISLVPNEVYESFTSEVLGLSLIGEEDGDKSAKIENLLLLLHSLPVAPVVGGIYWVMNTGGYYMTPIAAGMCFLYLSLWTGLTACTLRKLWARAALLFVSGTALTLSVASRPPIALAGVILIPFFVGILLDKRKKLQPKLLQAACFVVPVMLGAAGIMWYNHARFGSVTDFGAAYQLTVSNVNANKLRLSDFWGAMYTYFGGQTRPRSSFPYFEPQWGNLYALSHYVYAEGAVGWLRYPMVLGSILCLPVVLRRKGTAHLHTTDKQRKTAIVLCVLMSLLLAWMDYSMGGSNQRYLYDFASMLLCMSIPVLLLMNWNSAKHRYFYTLTCLALTASWCLEWLLLLENHDSGLCRRCPELYSTVERLVMFWN